jgi:succinyl-CoA synthetase beta subunit
VITDSLQGTNIEEAKKLIEASGYRMIITDDWEDAASRLWAE